MVATEVWLATGHRGSSQARPWCAHDGNSLGSTWALGLRRLRSTPLIRVQIASSGSTCGPEAMQKEVRGVCSYRTGGGEKEAETELKEGWTKRRG